ncbi:MAG: flavin monoamine oxidase family protein [Solirubrobacterales bacterium]
MNESEAEVAVIGAGLAGLSAARKLAQGGVDVVVIEARDRVGGRTENGYLGGEPVELGGQWVGPGQDEILGLIDELGLETFPTWIEGENLLDLNGSIRRYKGTVPKVNPVALAEVWVAMKRIDRLSRRVDPAQPWAAPRAERWDSRSVADWISGTVFTATARDLIRLAVHAFWAAEPDEISMLHFLAYSRAAGSIESLLETEGGAQDSRVVGGTQAISDRMAKDLGDRVVTGAPVSAVEWDGDAVALEAGGRVFRARRAIVTVPPVLAGRINWRPGLPEARTGLVSSMLPGRAIKAMAAYETPFWREEGLSGSATSIGSPVSMVFDNTPSSGAPGVLVSFFEASSADVAGAMPDVERRELVIGNLTRLFGEQASRPLGYLDRCWANEEFSSGCYGAFMPPGAWTRWGEALSEPVGPIHWAGAETATRWTGYMDGAISSGRRAATEVVDSI